MGSPTGERELVSLRWGLVPWSTKSLDQLKGRSTINARAEKVTTGWWAQPFKKRRCIVPASGFYEWRKSDRKPFGFDLANGNMIGFAGLWDAWKHPANGQWLQSFAIVITEPNELMASVHDRMPVILHPRDFDRWLGRDERERVRRSIFWDHSQPMRWKDSRLAQTSAMSKTTPPSCWTASDMVFVNFADQYARARQFFRAADRNLVDFRSTSNTCSSIAAQRKAGNLTAPAFL